jgi:basic membrane protein A and related proteins
MLNREKEFDMSKYWQFRFVLIVLLVVSALITACTETPSAPTEAESGEEAPVAEVEVEAEEEGEPCLRVAFVYFGTANDGGWTQSHDVGRLYLEEQLPCVETAFVENITSGSDSERVIRQFARDGYDLIITTGFDYMEATIEVSKEFPEIKFENCSGYMTSENAGNYFIAIEEAYYLEGVLVGLMEDSDLIGFVAPFPIGMVIRPINAFALGVKSVNPNATVKVVWTNTWYDPGVEREAAEALLDDGAAFIVHYQDTPAAIEGAAARGAFGLGNYSDQSWVAPESILTSTLWMWGPYYLERTQAIIDGTWEVDQYYGTLADGVADLAPIGSMVPQDIQDKVMEAKDQIISGELYIFESPLVDSEGTERIPAGEEISFDELMEWDWFVDNVEGELAPAAD